MNECSSSIQIESLVKWKYIYSNWIIRIFTHLFVQPTTYVLNAPAFIVEVRMIEGVSEERWNEGWEERGTMHTKTITKTQSQ